MLVADISFSSDYKRSDLLLIYYYYNKMGECMEKWMMMNADVSFPILFILASRKLVIISLLRAHSSPPPSFPDLFKQI